MLFALRKLLIIDGRAEIPKLSIEEFEATCNPKSLSPKNIADPDWPEDVGIECMKKLFPFKLFGSWQKSSHQPPQYPSNKSSPKEGNVRKNPLGAPQL